MTGPGAQVEVVSPGILTLVEDAGRAGLAGLGVSPSGFADRASASRANRLLGNLAGAALLEVIGHLELVTDSDLMIVVSGGGGPITVANRAHWGDHVLPWPAGALLVVGPATDGLRRYLAFRGGVLAPEVLGSRSRDVLAQLGPPPLRAGDVLPIGRPPTPWPTVDGAAQPPYPTAVELRIMLGPHDGWFTPESVRTFLSTRWEVGSDLSRVGIRMSGPPMVRAVDREVAPAAILRGSVQIPPSGRPTVFLADHPVTGGYPTIGVVVDSDTDLAAQTAPGSTVQFRSVRPPSFTVRRASAARPRTVDTWWQGEGDAVIHG